MDILVIGNGFDLAHDLRTTYKDFLERCRKKSLDNILCNNNTYTKLCKSNLWLKHFIKRQEQLGNTWIDLEDEIFRVIQFLKEFPAAKGSGSTKYMCPQLLTLQKDDKDFSFFNIENYSVSCDNNPQTDLKEYLIEHCNNELSVYIKSPKGFINLLYDQLREFTQSFETYLIQDVLSNVSGESIYRLSLQAIGIQPQDKNVFVLSFNYTNTCEKLYKQKFNTYCNLKIKPIYVHGQVCNSKNCNLILGTQSFDNKDIPANFNVFRKHNQRHRYGTIEAYQDFLMILTNPQMNARPIFHVIGHSLDKTDHNILKHVFLANKNAIINVYYHDEVAQERLINNITEIIGEEEVMTRVRFIHQHDKERGILRYKDETIVI